MQFQYIENDSMTLKEFSEAYHGKLPKLLYIVEGNYGTTIYDEASTGEVIRVHSRVVQARVLAREIVVGHADAEYLSLPLDTPYQFCVIMGQDDVHKPRSLRCIVRENSFPIKVKLAPGCDTFKVGQSVHEAKRYSHFQLMQEYDETFLRCNTIEGNGAVRLDVMQLALSSDIDVAIVTGIANKSAKKFREFLDKVNKDIEKADYTTRVGNPDITRVTKEGTGSGNSLPNLNFNLYQVNDQDEHKTNGNTTIFSADDQKFKTKKVTFQITKEEQLVLNLNDNDNVQYQTVNKNNASTDPSLSFPAINYTNSEEEHISSQDIYNDTFIESTETQIRHDERQIDKSTFEINVFASGIYEPMDTCILHSTEEKCIEILVPTARYARKKRDAPSGVYAIPNDICVCTNDDKETEEESLFLSKPNVPIQDIVSGVYEIPNDTDINALSNTTMETLSPPIPPERQTARKDHLESWKYQDKVEIMDEMLTKEEEQTKNVDSGIYEEAPDIDLAVPNQTAVTNDSDIYETVPEIEFKNSKKGKKNESKRKDRTKQKGNDIPKSKDKTHKKFQKGSDSKKTKKNSLPENNTLNINSTDDVTSEDVFAIYDTATEVDVKQQSIKQETVPEKNDFVLQPEAPPPPPMTNRIKQKLEKTLSFAKDVSSAPVSVYMTMENPKQVLQARNMREKGKDDITTIKGKTKTPPKVQHEQSIYMGMSNPLREINFKQANDVEVKPRLPLSNPPKRRHIPDKVMSPQELDHYVSMANGTLSHSVSVNKLKPVIPKSIENNRSSTLPKSFEPSIYLEMSTLTQSFRLGNKESGNQIYEDMAGVKK